MSERILLCVYCQRGIDSSEPRLYMGQSTAHRYRERCAEILQGELAIQGAELTASRRVMALLDSPETEDFDKALPLEAAHQVRRWGAEHDAGKNPEDWFWLIGYLAGKALAAHRIGDVEKAKHHCISAAAALRNWHAHIRSGASLMRPGIAEPGIDQEEG